MNVYVYKHQSTVNGKVYIGITSREPEERWLKGMGYSTNPPFYQDIQTYGWDSFTHEILDICDDIQEAEK